MFDQTIEGERLRKPSFKKRVGNAAVIAGVALTGHLGVNAPEVYADSPTPEPKPTRIVPTPTPTQQEINAAFEKEKAEIKAQAERTLRERQQTQPTSVPETRREQQPTRPAVTPVPALERPSVQPPQPQGGSLEDENAGLRKKLEEEKNANNLYMGGGGILAILGAFVALFRRRISSAPKAPASRQQAPREPEIDPLNFS